MHRESHKIQLKTARGGAVMAVLYGLSLFLPLGMLPKGRRRREGFSRPVGVLRKSTCCGQQWVSQGNAHIDLTSRGKEKRLTSGEHSK